MLHVHHKRLHGIQYQTIRAACTIMSRSSVVTSQRSAQQNSGTAMKHLLADPQLTANKPSTNHAAINKQKLKQTQQLNRAKQVQSELIAAQPVFKMNRFANVGSKVTQQLGSTTQRGTAQQQNSINRQQNTQSYVAPVQNFHFDNVQSTVYTAPAAMHQQEQYENAQHYNNEHVNNHSTYTDESIYNIGQLSIQPPVVAVHPASPTQHAVQQQQQQQPQVTTQQPTVRRQPNTQRQPSIQRQASNNAKRMSLKAPLDMHNDTYQPPSGNTQRDYARDNALAVINAKVNRPSSTETGSFKHSNHGQVPAYLQQRKAELDAIKAQKQADATRERVPAGTVRMSEEQRLETLEQLQQQLRTLQSELERFPLRVTTEARRVARQNHENKIQEIEDAIQLFRKQVVYISQ